MKILLIGPYWGNATHGAEPGIYDALIELGHEVSIWDHRVRKYRIFGGDSDLEGIELDTTNVDVLSDVENCTKVLCPGPGLNPDILDSKIFKNTESALRILWNSEPIRLGNYKGRIERNKKHFHVICTFDESEIPLYKDLGINALFLPQAFNPKWYHPIKLPRSQRFPGYICFMGSFGPKWQHRIVLLNKLKEYGFKIHAATVFDAKKVNHAYNMHDAVVNLSLYCDECGNPNKFKGFGIQQRIFECIGAGKVCITNEIPDGTNKLFTHHKNILYYNKDNLRIVVQTALDKKHRNLMESEIELIRDKHTYKARMESLINTLDW